jgi:SAM-dependent methyltransferase
VTQAGSISFDRAADYYDETRSLPEDIAGRVTELISCHLGGRRALEIGVGTGRMAIPLAATGNEIFGIDLSLPMMAKLVKKAGGNSLVPVVQADATRLPFGDGTFQAGLIFHVLHLIPSWQDAVAELVRVLNRPGVLIVEVGEWRTGLYREIHDRFAAASGLEKRELGLGDFAELDEVMATAGAAGSDAGEVAGTIEVPAETLVSRLEQGLYSFTWRLTAEQLAQAGAAVRRWLNEEFGSDVVVPADLRVQLRRYDLP